MPQVNLRGKEENEQSEVVNEMEVSAFEIKSLLNPNMPIGQTITIAITIALGREGQ